MITKTRFAKSLPTTLSAAIMIVALIISGCSKGVKDEMNELFHSVPANAGVVVCGNLETVVDQLGGEVKDGEIRSIGKASTLSKIGNSTQKDVAESLELIEGAAKEIQAGAFVVFEDGGNFYISCYLNDPASFKESVDEDNKDPWLKSGDVEYKDEYAIIGNRLWAADRMDVEKIKQFMNLSETQSFLSCEYAPVMAESDNAIDIWVSLEAIYSNLSFSGQAQARMGISMLFDAAQFLTGNVNFNTSSYELNLSPMTANYKKAKCVIELSKINPSVVAQLGGNANVVAAVSVSQKFVKQIQDLGSSMGGALPTEYMNILSPLDGTIAFASQASSMTGFSGATGYRAIVSTNGQQNAALAQILGMIGKVDINGNQFTVSSGSYGDGLINVADAAKQMKDAWFAMAFAIPNSAAGQPMKSFISLEPSDNSLTLSVKGSF